MTPRVKIARNSVSSTRTGCNHFWFAYARCAALTDHCSHNHDCSNGAVIDLLKLHHPYSSDSKKRNSEMKHLGKEY